MAGDRCAPTPIATQVNTEACSRRMPAWTNGTGKILEQLGLMQLAGTSKRLLAEDVASTLNRISGGAAKIIVGKDMTGSVESLPYHKLPDVIIVMANIGGVEVAVVPNADLILQRNFPTEVLLAGSLSAIGVARLN